MSVDQQRLRTTHQQQDADFLLNALLAQRSTVGVHTSENIISPKPKPQKPDDFILIRYGVLKDLWIHHNGSQLQWPSVVISAALVSISFVVPRIDIASLSNIGLWKSDPALIISTGLPLLISGIITLSMVYTMKKVRLLMEIIEREEDAIQTKFGRFTTFHDINHPGGVSGPGLIRVCMAICLAYPLTIFGSCFTFGWILGALFCTSIFLLWSRLEKTWTDDKKK